MSQTPANEASVSQPAVPPPLPPRPDEQQQLYTSPMMNPYAGANPYAAYGPGSYGGGMGAFGGYTGGINRFGYGGPPYYQPQDTGFARLAEESSRSAFQSAESIVQTVASVSMMLESTYTAIYSSFRAIVGVADQFSRLKEQLVSLAAAFALFRYLAIIWRKLLVWLRLKPANYAVGGPEAAWGEATRLLHANDVLGPAPPRPFPWSSVAFWAVAVGGPWMIYKLMSKIQKSVEGTKF